MNLCNTHDKRVVIIISILLHSTNIVFEYFKKSIAFPKSKRNGTESYDYFKEVEFYVPEKGII